MNQASTPLVYFTRSVSAEIHIRSRILKIHISLGITAFTVNNGWPRDWFAKKEY